MKILKYIAIVIFLSCTSWSSAQDIAKDALGLRVASTEGFGIELTYQHAFTLHNRLEIDLGLNYGEIYDGFKLTILDEYVWNINDKLNWYLGAGGGIASLKYDSNRDIESSINSYTFAFLSAIGGIEFDFNAPFVLSLDFRPELGLSNDNFRDDNFKFDIGLSLRYQLR